MSDITDKALLPAGMQDGLPPEAAREADAAERLVAHFDAWGYGRVKPPMMEFEENLLHGPGQAMADQTFRVQDPVSQRMLALRPDMTLQVARIAGSRMSNSPRPLRLAYAGQVVRVKGSQLRPERQFGQVGAELIGASGPAADVEVILMAVEALDAIGLENLSIDLGLPTLAGLVLDDVELSKDQSRDLLTALNRKDAAAVGALGDTLGDAATTALLGMIEAVGSAEQALEKLSAIDLPASARDLCTHLSAVVEGLKTANANIQLTVDPVEIRGFEYHTGVTFALFARAAKGELGRGGHYESEGNGNAESATGFTVFMDTVLQALPAGEQKGSVYLPANTPAAEARKLRDEGWRTISALDETGDADTEARRLNCTHRLEGGSVRELT
ncbi:ATP phosphoribosyltransferase regulatory subunit [Magnetovibrio sp. PR-2]|uniref:ATP phosphoribosyltransferase regulatory subunit n=1 Tax=Magnetovibrio sp. PR-2 TaxID=3120356 RepID=UPI002FCE5639